jgi:hypothetical protein
MNTTQNKAALWKSCVEQGIFDKVPAGMQPQVQGLFELTINQFNQDGMDPALANQMVLKEFKLKLGKMMGLSIPQKSFEEINEDYKSQYQVKLPDKIEFSKEKDSPLEDMDRILKSKAEQRQNEINEFFKEKALGTLGLDSAFPVQSEYVSSMPLSLPLEPLTQPLPPPLSQPVTQIVSPTSSDELQLHRRILESILESQIKIIDLLQRK